MLWNFWDESSKEEHIQRVAWFVMNLSKDYPIEIDFGVPEAGVGFSFNDGNHRLAAAIYMKFDYISAKWSGSESVANEFLYK